MEAEPGTTMRNVRLYKVGTRIIIEIDGAGEYLDQAILQMLTSCMGRPVEKGCWIWSRLTSEVTVCLWRGSSMLLQ